MNQPVIILGMHRSGTSMLTRILKHQGLFLGHKIQMDDEALFFLQLNRWILNMAGTEWDNPLPAFKMLQNPKYVERLSDYISTRLSGLATRDYLGGRFLKAKGRIGTHIPFPWGFKDPRTSITLPVWLRIFPDAKLLRIRRHGIDVAASLHTRHVKREKRFGYFRMKERMGLTMPHRIRMVESARCESIADALQIWAEYETCISHYLADIDAEQQMTIKFEDYVMDPVGHHQNLSSFLNIPLESSLPPGIAPDTSRAYAFRQDAELRTQETTSQEMLTGLGYGNI